MPTRRRKVKRKIRRRRIRDKKERPVRVYETRTGRRYIKYRGKRMYFKGDDTGLSTNELIRFIIQQFTDKKRKKRKTATKSKTTKTATGNVAPPTSTSYSAALERERHAMEFQIRKQAEQLERQIVKVEKAEKDVIKKTNKHEQLLIEYNAEGDIPTAEEITRVMKAEKGKHFKVTKEDIRRIQESARQEKEQAKRGQEMAEARLQEMQEKADLLGAQIIESQRRVDEIEARANNAEQRSEQLDKTAKKQIEKMNLGIDRINKNAYEEWYKSIPLKVLRKVAAAVARERLSNGTDAELNPKYSSAQIKKYSKDEIFKLIKDEPLFKEELIRKNEDGDFIYKQLVVEPYEAHDIVFRQPEPDRPFAISTKKKKNKMSAPEVPVAKQAPDVPVAKQAPDTESAYDYYSNLFSSYRQMGVRLSEKQMQEFRELIVKNGLSESQIDELMNIYKDEPEPTLPKEEPTPPEEESFPIAKFEGTLTPDQEQEIISRLDDELNTFRLIGMKLSASKLNELIEGYEREGLSRSEIDKLINSYEDVMKGNGKKSTGDDGLYNVQMEKMMNKYPKFVGVFASDELSRVPKNKNVFGFIMNTKPRKVTTGGHWVAVYIDAVKDMSVEYYDSFADSPSKQFLKDIKKIIDALKSNVYLKFKVNKIKDQNAKTRNCGWFAMRFLINRFKNIPFKDISGYSDTVKGEKNVKKLKAEFGYI